MPAVRGAGALRAAYLCLGVLGFSVIYGVVLARVNETAAATATACTVAAFGVGSSVHYWYLGRPEHGDEDAAAALEGGGGYGSASS